MMVQAIERRLVWCGFCELRSPQLSLRVTGPLCLLTLLALLILSASPASAGTQPCDCESCHGTAFHGENWQGCSGCHQSPPATGTHLVHYSSDPLTILRYGDTENRSTTDQYRFGCGNCHPIDRAKHRDGSIEVELYDPLAPAGSMKAKNPPTAAYNATTKTCSDVYCHSGYTVTSGVVGMPLTNPPDPVPSGSTLNMTVAGNFIMDETCSNLTYAPYTVTTTREYQTTPAWGASGTFTSCTECHAFPLTTYYPTVYAGVGDSHQWVDDWGWNWRHAYNMFGSAVPCRTCHYATVTAAGSSYWTTGQGGASIVAYNPVALASRATHVNGTADVAFDTVNGYRYPRNTYSLVGATYDPVTKTCSDVPCHYSPAKNRWQKTVKWGAPWRDEHESGEECDVCHRMGYLNETCEAPQ